MLDDVDLAPGDFVRWVKQVLDLAEQIADAAGDHRPLRDCLATPIDGPCVRGVVAYCTRERFEPMRRGVVAYSADIDVLAPPSG